MRYFTLLLLLAFSSTLTAQQFTQLLNDPLVNKAGDSRSINIVDVNGDDWEDVYITNGLSGGQNNELYINQGNGTFAAVTGQPIVQDASPSDGATCADTDNDGDIDCFMVTWYNKPNFFYKNDGSGIFERLPEAITGGAGTYSETAAFGDYNNDGLVDVYITNSEGDLKNMLYRNTGNNIFVKETATWLNETKLSRGAVWSDYDNDGDLDLYVANESNTKNSLFKNNGDGSFTQVTNDPSVTPAQSSMTASWADVNNDGFQDLFVGNSAYFQEQSNRLYINNGSGGFTEAPSSAINLDGGCSYGSAFADYDNDGDLDLFVANGFCNGDIVNFLYKNNGFGGFSRDEESLPNFVTPCSFGTAWGDLNNDGFQDLVVSTCKNSSASPQPKNLAFINNGNSNHWLKVALTGTTSNHSAIGAKVLLKATINGQSVTQTREISAQTGYCGQNSLVAHFGLGASTAIESVTVLWPSGLEQVFGNINVDKTISIIEGQSSDVSNPKKNETLQVVVAPNPVRTSLNWTLSTISGVGRVQFELADLQGRICAGLNTEVMAAGVHPFRLEISTLPAGTYFLRTVFENGATVSKCIIE